MNIDKLAAGDPEATLEHLRDIEAQESHRKGRHPFPPMTILLDNILDCLLDRPDVLAAIPEGPPFELPVEANASRCTSRSMRVEVTVVPRDGALIITRRRLPPDEILPDRRPL